MLMITMYVLATIQTIIMSNIGAMNAHIAPFSSDIQHLHCIDTHVM